MINNKKILLFGGSGSLGNKFIETYLDNSNVTSNVTAAVGQSNVTAAVGQDRHNKIINYSRDECKHWKMSLKYKSPDLSFIIGNNSYTGIKLFNYSVFNNFFSPSYVIIYDDAL